MNILHSLLNYTNAEGVVFLFGETFNVSLNWLGKLIKSLIEGVGIVSVGIILFSVVLKLIVLPFDIYQRISMSKQNLKMKENQAKLEKLQKQYANDKAMYNQKMMEMYKANGISMFSSCLPAILSIVIFIVAINAFNAYSQYANLSGYNKMVKAYNASVTPITATVEDDISLIEEGKYILVQDETAAESGKYVYFVVSNEKTTDGVTTKLYTDANAEGIKAYISSAKKTYYVTDEAMMQNAEIKAAIEKIMTENEGMSQKAAASKYVRNIAQKAVSVEYKANIQKDMSFLWVKNIWDTDASYKHPVQSYSDLSSSLNKAKLTTNEGKIKFSRIGNVTDAYSEYSYNEVTGELKYAKKQANGFFIMIALSIGTILLQQWISMRTQKEQQKFSSVDGQGAMNQKTMMIMMTVMFGIFSFMYSAAFSIYMITSNILSLIMTVVINKLVEVSLAKQEEKALQEKYNKRFPGRKYENKDNKKSK